MPNPKLQNKFIHFSDIILFEDEDILVANKPLYMASLDDKSNRNLNHLAKKYDENLSLCHRLDKMTSGVILLAKGKENYREIALQFQKRKVKKVYKTLVNGVHNFKEHTINLPLYITTNKRVAPQKEYGKKALTVVDTETSFRNYSLLACQPITGRMHQIRVHLAASGCPIVGDELYGGKDLYLSEIKRNYRFSNRKEEQPLNHGYLLHAYSISFTHPRTGEAMTFEAPYPKNFSVVLKMLNKHNPA